MSWDYVGALREAVCRIRDRTTEADVQRSIAKGVEHDFRSDIGWEEIWSGDLFEPTEYYPLLGTAEN